MSEKREWNEADYPQGWFDAARAGWREWHSDYLTDDDIPWMAPSYEHGFRDAVKWMLSREGE